MGFLDPGSAGHDPRRYAVKLRRLLHPELGMDGSGKESDLPCLHHVLSVIEREAQSGG